MRGGDLFTILGTMFVALILSILPIPNWAMGLRPEFMPLFLIFWSVSFPDRVGIGTAWIFGFILDLFRDGAIGGQYAFACTIVVFMSIKIHQRFRIYPIWQQAVIIGFLITLYQIALFIIKGMGGTLHDFGWRFWSTIITSMLVWPIIFIFLSGMQNRIKMSS